MGTNEGMFPIEGKQLETGSFDVLLFKDIIMNFKRLVKCIQFFVSIQFIYIKSSIFL